MTMLVLVVLLGSFLLGTNFRFHVHVEFEFVPSSGLRQMLRSPGLRRMIDWALATVAPKPVAPAPVAPAPVAPAPKPVAPVARKFPTSPNPFGRPSALGANVLPPKPLPGTPRPGGFGSPASNPVSNPVKAFSPWGGNRFPTKPASNPFSVWNGVEGRWYPPNTKAEIGGGYTWPDGGLAESNWNFGDGCWKPSPKKEDQPQSAAIRYTGGDYDEYEDEDELIEDDENDPL